MAGYTTLSFPDEIVFPATRFARFGAPLSRPSCAVSSCQIAPRSFNMYFAAPGGACTSFRICFPSAGGETPPTCSANPCRPASSAPGSLRRRPSSLPRHSGRRRSSFRFRPQDTSSSAPAQTTPPPAPGSRRPPGTPRLFLFHPSPAACTR